jgi:serine/threonine-protein kinase
VTATTLDATLSAIVAADRLALSEVSEGGTLLQRRLRLFYGYFALISVLAVVLGFARRMLAGVDQGLVGLLLRLQGGHALLLLAVLAALRFMAGDVRWLRALDLLAIAATWLGAAFTVAAMPNTLSVDVSLVSFFGLFFVLHAALVPGKPWLAAAVAALSALPCMVALAVMYRRGHVPNLDQALWAALGAMSAGVTAAYVVSRTIYGLRRVVERAVELGQYIVQKKIGEGGMGVVYLASHAMLKRPTAIKLIAPQRAGEATLVRFEREVMAASRLSHPNNVAIYDFGRTRGGVFYYAMELIDGQDLARIVEHEGPLPVARALHVLRQVADALGEAHAAGLIHRDVKPENVMLCVRGGVPDFVKLLDFGLVKDVADASAARLTAENVVAGTPLYMAPEAMLAPDTVGPAADVYAVGCLAYFLLTGRPPFLGETVVAVCAAHIGSEPEPPSRHAKETLPQALDALVLGCLQKDPLRRPSTRALSLELAGAGP